MAKKKKDKKEETKKKTSKLKSSSNDNVKKNEKKKKTKKEKKIRKLKSKEYNWYIINTYSGHENKVANELRSRIEANKLERYIPKVLVPTQDKIVVKKGKKETVKEKIFPGYVLLEMVVNDDTLNIVRNTSGVIGFVGSQKKPTPLRKKELKSILEFTKVKQPTFQATFSVSDAVKVQEGPFKDFVGSISEINQDKGQVKVLLSVFGRETPVVLDFSQVKKI